jgi:ABC-2 type transport system permease protein
MLERIRRMLVKEFLQLSRDPRMKAVIFAVPIVQSLIFGYAVTTDVRNVATAIYDLDRSPESRELVARFTGSGYFEAVAFPRDGEEIERLVDGGRVQAVIAMNPGFGAAIRRGGTSSLQVIVDGTDSNTASLVLTYASRVAGSWSESIMIERVGRSGGKVEKPLEMQSRSWFNPNLESRNFYVPGVVALLVTLITLMLTSMAIVREKEVGTIEQIVVTPIRQYEFIIGKSIPFALIAFVDVILVTMVAVFWFRIPILGSGLLLLAATGVYLLSTIGIGLFISTVSRTQQQAMMATFFFFIPAILLSGFMFPIANMPQAVQYATYLNPLRYFLVIIRGIFLKGIGPAVLWPQIAALFVLGIAMLAFATSRFRKTVA